MANQKNKGKASSSKGQRTRMVSVKKTGDYALPTARPVVSRNGGPRITPSAGGRGVTVSNTERLGTVSITADSTVTLKKTGFSLNPASTTLFPWLSTIARSYQLYRWKSLRISYLPIVATTQGGYVEHGIFYDYEDYVSWVVDAVNYFNLSSLGEFCSGPPYAGGQISVTENTRGTGEQNWFGSKVDVNMAHRRYPWLTVDPSPSTDHTHNLAVGALAAFQTYVASGGAGQAFGVPYVSYEIEFLHPAIPGYNTGALSLLRSGDRVVRQDEAEDCPSGCPPPFPPIRPAPDPPVSAGTTPDGEFVPSG
nr:MAG: coat protein [Narnaviridae sp.]